MKRLLGLDTPSTLKEKLEKNIPIMLKEVYEYLLNPENKMTEIVTDGIYRKRLCKEDYTIDLNNDKAEIIMRKINSQKDYDGAIVYVDNKEYRIIDYKVIDSKLLIYAKDKSTFIIEIQEG